MIRYFEVEFAKQFCIQKAVLNLEHRCISAIGRQLVVQKLIQAVQADYQES